MSAVSKEYIHSSLYTLEPGGIDLGRVEVDIVSDRKKKRRRRMSANTGVGLGLDLGMGRVDLGLGRVDLDMGRIWT